LDFKKKLPLFEKLDKVNGSMELPDCLKQLLGFMTSLSDEAEDRDFINESMHDALDISLTKPDELDIDVIQNYYGEKIALYFLFLKNMAARLKFFGFVGVLIFVLDMVMLKLGNDKLAEGDKNNAFLQIFHIIRIIFALFITIWTTVFLEYWKRREKCFSIRYG
jgi:hypothetical protein